MGKIVFVIPYQEIQSVVEEVFREQNNDNWQLEIIFAPGVRAVSRHNLDGDVVIARGVTAAALKKNLTSMPVVDLMVSGYDIMRAVLECKRRFDAQKVAVVGARDMIYGAETIQTLLGINMVVVPVNNEDDAEAAIRRLAADGISTIIGGVMSTRIAAKFGLNSVFIETGREAIYQALVEAKRVGQVRLEEQAKSAQWRAVLEYSADGVVAIDYTGHINMINKAALKLTGLTPEVLGKHVDSVLPQLGLSKVLATNRVELGKIETVGSQQLAVNCAPTLVKGRIVGAVATFQPVSTIQELEGKIRRRIYRKGHVAKATFADIIGKSEAIKQAISSARECSKVDSNVLILGETGAGKEIFAQSIHNASCRAAGPFVAVNCAALPENLLESELFGYVEGAFTGAARGGKMGLFELAHGGTIFLDEIAEISPKLQGRLLRVLEEREIMRLGDDRVIPVDVRVIAATNQDLASLMQEGRFRADLYYRLDTLRLIIPPLRQRTEDIELLLEHYLKLYCKQFGRPEVKLSPAAKARLVQYPWPGNVRELRNIAERLVVFSKNELIDLSALQSALPAVDCILPKPLKQGQNRQVLLEVLRETNYHYGKAAAKLGISRTTLWRWLKHIPVK